MHRARKAQELTRIGQEAANRRQKIPEVSAAGLRAARGTVRNTQRDRTRTDRVLTVRPPDNPREVARTRQCRVLFGTVDEAVPPLAALEFIGAIGAGQIIANQREHRFAAAVLVSFLGLTVRAGERLQKLKHSARHEA